MNSGGLVIKKHLWRWDCFLKFVDERYNCLENQQGDGYDLIKVLEKFFLSDYGPWVHNFKISEN